MSTHTTRANTISPTAYPRPHFQVFYLSKNSGPNASVSEPKNSFGVAFKSLSVICLKCMKLADTARNMPCMIAPKQPILELRTKKTDKIDPTWACARTTIGQMSLMTAMVWSQQVPSQFFLFLSRVPSITSLYSLMFYSKNLRASLNLFSKVSLSLSRMPRKVW